MPAQSNTWPLKPVCSAASLEASWQRFHPHRWSTFMRQLDRRGIPYLSHSKLTSLDRCPRCYYREYFLGQKEKYPAMHIGTLFHEAAKNLYASIKAGQIQKPSITAKQIRAKSLATDALPKLRNAAHLLHANRWTYHQILAVEECFFMDLTPGLPPIIGIPDLVLRRNDSLLVVDHKTSKSFKDLDPSQLVLYAEHLRHRYSISSIIGVFDEYRLVPDLSAIRTPAFRRTPVAVDYQLLPPLITRYRKAWKQIVSMHKHGEPSSSSECRTCNLPQYSL